MGQSRPLFRLFSSFSHHISITNWKKRRWSAWYLNPGLQDSRRRRNHGAMAATIRRPIVNRVEVTDAKMHVFGGRESKTDLWFRKPQPASRQQLMKVSVRKQEMRKIRVTRFGEILPLWKNFKNLWQIGWGVSQCLAKKVYLLWKNCCLGGRCQCCK